MSEGPRCLSPMNNGADENASPQQSHPAPPPFNPMPSSHANSGVHSVVPDLMRVYESLTKTNQQQQQAAAHDVGSQQQSQEAHYFQQQQQQHPQLGQHLPQQQPMHIPAPAQHVNYAYITSEEQYQQLYQYQSGDPNQQQMPPQQPHAYPHVQSQMATSLPYIPAPYGATTNSSIGLVEALPLQDSLDAAEKTSGGSDGSSRSSSRSSLRRKRSSATQQQLQAEEQDSSPSTAGGKSKGRKKAKEETDGRWSKRFTWPEELHRDFVSAVFDVGLKHSSPSTVLEHMPKHPQITSERIKSHLQKYRVHRVKSKQEFMSSYESSLKKFKAGDMDKVTSLADGDAAAHLSHSALTDVADPTPSNSKGGLANDGLGVKQEQPSQLLFQGGAPAAQPATGPPPGHEALMLPKLTEAEKTSPIGASMGYLLGLFFSLKKQLLMQRAMSAGTSTEQAPAPLVASDPNAIANGPVAAVYNSFVGTAPNQTASSGGGGGNTMQAPIPMTAPPVMTATSMDWSSSTNPPPSTSHDGPPPPQPGAGGVPNPVAVQTGSTRINLEASSMMKREMQNQMAFQNKMRALKQQELNKYKNVMPIAAGGHHDTSAGGYKQPQDGSASSSAYMENSHGQPGKDANNASAPQTSAPVDTEHLQQAQHTPHPQDLPGGGVDGDTNSQGAGETAAAARARVPSFSMSGNDDFWNADVMDEQLFEFLMNN